MAWDWLRERHPTYLRMEETWIKNERRLRGGDDILDELVQFDWEQQPDYDSRQLQASYINFPDLYLRLMSGHLMRVAPDPEGSLDFGSLGEVRRERSSDEPTAAEMVYYNADGVGRDGSQWDNFWLSVWMRAGATGHRWVMVEAPEQQPQTIQDEIDGLRPYLVEFSPLAVTNWFYRRGHLQFAVIKSTERNPRADGDEMVGNVGEDRYLLLVREGFGNLGSEFAGGGWWQFDEEYELIEGQHGTWESTGGEIPMFPLYYDRAETGGVPRLDEASRAFEGLDRRTATTNVLFKRLERLATASIASFSRPGITELGQVAVSYMNLSSAADFDAWEAAASKVYITGVDVEGYNLARQKAQEGSKVIPVPTNQRTDQIPQIHDGSLGAVAAEVFERRLANKRKEAEDIATREASGSPYSSGVSKRVGFKEGKSPRLATAAAEIEQAQNTALYFLERRWGKGEPEGSVRWTRDFDLLPLAEEIRSMFELEELAGIHSPTLDAKAMLLAARVKGIINDDEDISEIEAELIEAAESLSERTSQEAAFTRSLRGSPPPPPVGDGTEPTDEDEQANSEAQTT